MNASTLTGARRERRLAPEARGALVVGSFPALRRDPIAFYLEIWRRHGDVVTYWLGPWRNTLIVRPEHVKHVLQDNHTGYAESWFYDKLVPLVGRGLLTSEGELWKRQRRLVQPAFQRERLARFAGTMVACAAAMLDRWEARAARAEPFDVAEQSTQLALEIAGRALLSIDLSDAAGEIGQALTVAFRHLAHKWSVLVDLPEWVPTPRNVRFRRALRAIERQIARVLAAERAGARGEAGDLLCILLRAHGEGGEDAMSDAQLRDELLRMLIAGHETTANALAWTFYLLSKHPDARRRLEEEVETVLGGRPPAFEDLPRLEYATRVFEESMRLFPPAWGFSREAVAADEIGGYEIPAGTTVTLSPYLTHRHPEFWENPEGFDPDRFAPAAVAARPRFAYFPFGGGPRQCIGNAFATMEATIVLSMVAQRFRLDLVPGHPVEHEALATLRPRRGIFVWARRRERGGGRGAASSAAAAPGGEDPGALGRAGERGSGAAA